MVQSGFGAFDNELFPKTDGGGAALRAKRFDNDSPLEATQADRTVTVPALIDAAIYGIINALLDQEGVF